MTIKSKVKKIVSIAFAAAAVTAAAGTASEAAAQSRDPFAKPAYARPRPVGGPVKIGKDGKPLPDNAVYMVPPIEQRIEFYKRMREQAAASGQPIPKVTSVLTLDEMAVIGIFRTPRGYAAMVEATPIKLSYTIYPGEKFFDGQLVAVEENQLVFRKVTKTGPGKFLASVENKQLRKYTTQQQLQGTAPSQQTAEQPSQPAGQPSMVKTSAPAVIVSPLDEMNSKPEQPADKKTDKTAKRSKVARSLY
ncbi:MAG: hypothetical protein ACK4S4_04385 [Pyrinomonadaceae bacterium]